MAYKDNGKVRELLTNHFYASLFRECDIETLVTLQSYLKGSNKDSLLGIKIEELTGTLDRTIFTLKYVQKTENSST